MKKTRLWKTMVTFALSAALLLSATAVFAETKQTTEDGIAVTAEADENGFVIEDGVLTKYEGTATEVVIPDGVTEIGSGAFSGCSSLTRVTIPEGVTSMGKYAFEDCSSLTKVTIPDSLTSIEEYVFKGCSSNLTIYGISGSYAETYAKENDIPFVALSTTDFAINKDSTSFTYTKGSSDGATIKCSGDLADFLNVYVDGTLIDKTNYTLKEGSTIITFTQTFMDTLSVGEHIFTLEYTEGRTIEVSMMITDDEGQPSTTGTTSTTDTTDTIGTTDATDNSQQQADVSAVKTEDNASMALWMVLAFASAGCGALVLRRKLQTS